MPDIRVVARYAVFGAFALSVIAAFASWLVRTRRVSPFGALGRTLRAASEPLIRPVETRLVRRGGNPVNAGWWLVITVAIAGLLLLWLMNWAIRAFYAMAAAASGGPRGLLVFGIVMAYNILLVALLLRVIASWFGYFRYARWMRPAYALTDWVVEPIRRRLPQMGTLDWSPLLAWLVLWVLKQLLLSVV